MEVATAPFTVMRTHRLHLQGGMKGQLGQLVAHIGFVRCLFADPAHSTFAGWVRAQRDAANAKLAA
eukprot:gene6825-5731_t